MKYEKPQVIVLSPAIEAIQCSTEKSGGQSDSICTGQVTFSPSAYEADE